MNALLKKFVLYSTAVFAVGIFVTTATPAYAQRDAGAKARGELGTGFWNPKYQSQRSSLGGVSTRHSYSYEPAATVAGCQGGSSQAVVLESTTAQAQAVRRSFSYEPARPSRSHSTPKKAPWQYPKTDPRRYRS